MSDPQKPVEIRALAEAVLGLIEDGAKWPELRMTDLAARLDIDTAALQKSFTEKSDIFAALFIYVDQRMAAEVDSALLSETPRDRLFEVMMARFDIIHEYPGAWRHLFYETFKNPALMRSALPRFHASMELMLRLADLNGRSGGILTLRTGAAALVYLNALRVWLHDSSEDMAQTMAELDRGLTRLVSVMDMLRVS